MPPFLPRKRPRTASPEPEKESSSPPKKKNKAAAIAGPRRKPTLFEDLDAGTTSKDAVKHKNAALKKLDMSDDEESSLSELSEEEFLDVPNAKRAEEEEEDDDDIEFEDVDTSAAPGASENIPTGDLELTLVKDTRISITNPLGTKKGPSNIERQIRINTHKMHVQALMYHNAIRNSWLCDKEVQEILLKALPTKIGALVDKWRQGIGLEVKSEETPKGKGKGKGKAVKGKKPDPRSERDWGEPAKQQPTGSDPTPRLLKYLINYWRGTFRITAPGLRKLGYMSLQTIDEELKSFRDDPHDLERHGEKIQNLEAFRQAARSMEGSRDVGGQLFTALLRALGLESRMVASLQPIGFGWSQGEDAFEKNPRSLKKRRREGIDEKPAKASLTKGMAKSFAKNGRKSTAGRSKGSPMDLDSDILAVESDNESVVDVTPSKAKRLPSLPYDKDTTYPIYWTEILSPVSNTYIPVDAMVLPGSHGCTGLVAVTESMVERFENRGPKSEKAKQVTAYIIGHSADGTAKDVTTRYLKKHMWPGRTKGSRYPVEKVPVHDHRGKVKRYETKDWFKTVMSGYVRGTKTCPRTEIDDLEDSTDLKPAKREKKVIEEGKETLDYYKKSETYVLERHLTRDWALVPGAKHVKMFASGKGEAEKVFLRKDAVKCKSTETWHKEGRAPMHGEEPLKRVPFRAATTNRRRELAEAEHQTGEKMLQGLYSEAQTDWIIPSPIENGIIPKNAFGNIDLYVESMLPEGAAHVPYRKTAQICRKLEIDYAEAVTGFEFGHRMAVPVITGVVVAEEHVDKIMKQWEQDEAERVRKEDEKRRIVAENMWRKMLMGLRIIEKVRKEYGDAADEEDLSNPFHNKTKITADADTEARKRIMDQQDEEMAGGFLPNGFDAEEVEQTRQSTFLPATHEEEDEEGAGGGFFLEDDDEPTAEARGQSTYPTPQSLQSQINTKKTQASDEDVDRPTEVEKPAPKKRGRPSGSAKKPTTPAVMKTKTPAKRASATKGMGKIVSVGGQFDGGDDSSLSEVDSELEEQTRSTTKKPRSSAKIGPAKSKIPNTRTPASKSRATISDSDEESDARSLPSESPSEAESEEIIKPPPKKRGRPARASTAGQSTTPRSAVTRKTPKRATKETPLKSKYFESDVDDHDEE